MILWIVLFFLVIALVMFFHKLAMKSSMEKKLGRKVEDRELTSLTAWMEDNKGDQSSK
ncbi:MAG TPA: hypothetical protein VIF81_08880 [Pyrinomonadaceae bacterium]|jgi:hypothetical protein